MHRLFVAIRPPQPMRRALLGLMGGVANARWQSDDQLHVTLRFIGEVDRHMGEDIAAALGGVHHPAFTIELGEVGHFERRGRIDALWVGAVPAEPLLALHNKVDRALVAVGLPPETRAFLPHVTIARFGKGAGPIGGMLESTHVPSTPCEIAEFCLYESTLGREGSSYNIVARYPLALPNRS